MEEKLILSFAEVKELLGGIGRDKLYKLLRRAAETGKPFPVLSTSPYRVPAVLFKIALNAGKIKI